MTFGKFVRAARLGWYRCSPLGAWMRICDLGPHRWRLELWPLDDLVPSKSPGIPHRCIGDRAGGEIHDDIRDSLICLRGVRRIKRPVAMEIGEDGKILREAA